MYHQKIAEWENIPMKMRPKVRYWLPAAAMDEEDLKTELKELKLRGFGGVEVVTLSTMPDEIMTGEDGWGRENWNHMVQVIADTTASLGMTMDLANGPMWPISMPTVKSIEDPAVCCELTFGILECPQDGHYVGELPERKRKHKEGKPQLVAVMAYLETGEKVLKKDSYQDLMGFVSGAGEEAVIDCQLPAPEPGSHWLIFAFYSQPSAHKTGKDQYYVIDHLSRAGVQACEEYWDSVLKEQPYASMESFFCDSLEYESSLDWTPLFPEEFEKRRGYSILPYLPFIAQKFHFPVSEMPDYQMEEKALSDMIDRDYRETLTELYCEYHLEGLEKMAEKYGKTIRYQTAYNKPFEGERCPLYVAIPENEALGRPAMDYQKTMAAAAHLGRKERYSFECAAEFGNSYGQNYEDLMWWVKRSLMSGMNAQVLHGASYSGGYHGTYAKDGKMEGVTWPGYEAFGKVISNYWNRTLSVEDSRGCMDAIARLNSVFRKQARVDCAIYRQSYENNGMGSEFCFYPDDGALTNAGYTYETVSSFLLSLPVCTVRDGRLDPDGVSYKCLIVQETEHISTEFLERLGGFLNQGFQAVWIGTAPVSSEFYQEWTDQEKRSRWEKLLSSLWMHKNLIHAENRSQVPELLKEHGIFPDAELPGDRDLITAERLDQEKQIRYYAIYGYNRVKCTPEDPNPEELACSAMYQRGTTKGTYQRPGQKSRKEVEIRLNGEGTVYRCNPWDGKLTPVEAEQKQGKSLVRMEIEEDELVLLAMCEKEVPKSLAHEGKEKEKLPICFHTLELFAFVPDEEKEISFLRSGFVKEGRLFELDGLKPWRKLAPELECFAGKGVYTATFFLQKKEEGRRYVLGLGNVCDTFHVYLNGEKAEFPDQVMKTVDLTELVQEGENRLQIEVVSNLYNRLLKDGDSSGMPFKVPYFPKDYGIWESDGRECGIFIL